MALIAHHGVPSLPNLFQCCENVWQRSGRHSVMGDELLEAGEAQHGELGVMRITHEDDDADDVIAARDGLSCGERSELQRKKEVHCA